MLFKLFNRTQARAPLTRAWAEPSMELDNDGLPSISAKSSLAPVPLPTKMPNKPQALASFKTQVAKSTSALSNTDRRLANTDVTQYRGGASTNAIIRDMVASSPDLGATVNAYLRTGIPEEYTLLAYDMEGSINVDASRTVGEILRRMTLIGDPSLGYNPVTDLDSLSESLGKELLQYGAMALELVLDKQRLPTYMNPVSVTKLQFMEEDGGVYPVQVLSGNVVKLDIPTFFYISLDQDLLTAYASSYLESAIQAVLADGQFMNDLRKAMNRSIQPRMIATLVMDKLMNSFSPVVRNDKDLQATAVAGLIEQLTNQLQDLQPEDALISTDAVVYDTKAAGGDKGDTAGTLQAVQSLIENKLTAGSKSLPAVLGRDAGASSSTTSTMLFLKNANILRRKLNTLYSRALTMAMRILGEDVYVEFKYRALDLRPESELEAYKAMEQSRVTEQWSLGAITDETAIMQLTGKLPPAGFKTLAGTMFKTNQAASANPASQTAVMNGSKDNLKPKTPAQPKD